MVPQTNLRERWSWAWQATSWVPDRSGLASYVLTNVILIAGLWKFGRLESVRDTVLGVLASLIVSGIAIPLWNLWLNWIRAPYAIAYRRQPTHTYQLMSDLLDTASELALRKIPHDKGSPERKQWFKNLLAYYDRAIIELQPRLLRHEWSEAFGYTRPVPATTYANEADSGHAFQLLVLDRHINALRKLMDKYAPASPRNV